MTEINEISIRIQNIIRSVVDELVEKKEDVQLKMNKGDRSLVFELYVHKTDVGKIIGKEGKIITSLRNVLIAIAAKNNVHLTVEVIDD